MSTISQIRKQFDEVITYSQGIPHPKTKQLFKRWFRAKKEFIRAFGGLIYEIGEFSAQLSEENKQYRIADFQNWIVSKYRLYDLSHFIEDNKNSFYNNTVSYSKRADVPIGMKLIKSFKFFVEDKEQLNEIQSRASMIIQENSVSGTLCLSVHPLDFLSSSENNHNWRSCHALDGEYRAGNLSYMTDSSTIICYLRADGEQKIPNFPNSVPWNSKKWRNLLFFSNDRKMMFAGRPYPCELTGMLDYIRTAVLNLEIIKLKTDFYYAEKLTKWSNEYIKEFNGVSLNSPYIISNNNTLIRMNKLIKDGKYAKHYDDLLYSSCYTPYYCYVKDDSGDFIRGTTRFAIGGDTYCLGCGEEYIDTEDSMLCWNCSDSEYDDYYHCAICGIRHHQDYGTWVEDEFVCDNCYANHCSTCHKCGYPAFNENLEDGLCNYCRAEEKE